MSFNNVFSKKEILKKVGNIHQLCGIRDIEYKGGDQNLTKAFVVNNGSGLEFTVNQNKCLDIYEMKFKGINLGFQSKADLNSPYQTDHRGGYNNYSQGCGFLYTAGLANVGSGLEKGGDLQSYHGMIKNKAAENLSAIGYWYGDDYRITVSGDIREAAFFGRNLLLSRTISTKAGENIIKIKDIIENQDFKPDNVMLLYHLNLGFPLLDEGCKFITPAVNVVPLGDYAKDNIGGYAEITHPKENEPECVYAINTSTNKEGGTISMLVNKKIGIAVYVKYNAAELPYLIEWKSMKSGDYAFGMLPSNCRPIGREKALEAGDTKKLKSFESWEVNLEIGVLDDLDEIEQTKQYIEKLKNKRENNNE